MPAVDKPSIPIGIPGVEDVVNLPSNLVKGAKALPDVLRNFFTHPKETAKGFVQGASEAATPGRTGLLALLSGGATLPATLAAAGGQAAAEGARVATDAPNAPHSLGDAALDVAGAASTPGLAAAVPAGLAKAGGAAKFIKRGLGGALGGYEGYKYGGVPGGVVGALGGAAVGGGDVRLPGRLAPLSDFLAGDSAAAEVKPSVPEATFGPSAAPGARPGFRSVEVPGSSFKGLQDAAGVGRDPQLLAPDAGQPPMPNRSGYTAGPIPEAPSEGFQSPEMPGANIPNRSGYAPGPIPEAPSEGFQSPELPHPFTSNLSGYTGEAVPPSISDAQPVADELQYAKELEDAGFSKGMVSKLSRDGLMKAIKGPDLYDLATAEKGPVAAGEPWTDNGKVIGRTTDSGEGSTGFEPEPPPFTFEGQNLNGQPPAVGGTEIPGWKGFPPMTEEEMADHILNQGTFTNRLSGLSQGEGMLPTELVERGPAGLAGLRKAAGHVK